MSRFQPNSSKEHLLSSRVSVQSSRPASIHSVGSIDSIVAAGDSKEQSYRGYPSKDAYLEALREWVESKMYFESDTQLRGFYGTKTKEDYLAQPSWRDERRARKERERRATITRTQVLPPLPEEGEAQVVADPASQSKGSKLKRVFNRRATVG